MMRWGHRAPMRETPEAGPELKRPEPEVWLQVGDEYVITSVPNRLRGVKVNNDGEAI